MPVVYSSKSFYVSCTMITNHFWNRAHQMCTLVWENSQHMFYKSFYYHKFSFLYESDVENTPCCLLSQATHARYRKRYVFNMASRCKRYALINPWSPRNKYWKVAGKWSLEPSKVCFVFCNDNCVMWNHALVIQLWTIGFSGHLSTFSLH